MTFLFGVEFSDCAVVLTRGDASASPPVRPKVYVAVRAKLCAKYIAPLVTAVDAANAAATGPEAAMLPAVVGVPIVGKTEAKGGDFAKDDATFEKLVKKIVAAGGAAAGGGKPVLATLAKEFSVDGDATGPVLARWCARVVTEGGGADGSGAGALLLVNGRGGCASALAVKDDDEIIYIKKASLITTFVLKGCLVTALEGMIEKHDGVAATQKTHRALAEEVDAFLVDHPAKIPKVGKKLSEQDKAALDSCFAPVVQSGGAYDLSANAESNDEALKYDVIIASLGARYQGYCSWVTRTYFVDATDEQVSFLVCTVTFYANLVLTV